MSALAFATRALMAQADARGRRERVAERLARGIARVGGALPALMPAADRPTLSVALGTSAYPDSAAATLDLLGRPVSYTLLRGRWAQAGATFPQSLYLRNQSVTFDLAAPRAVPGGAPLIRFHSSAPDLEIMSLSSEKGYRLKVDGQYVATGMLPVGTGNGDVFYQRVKWGDGSAAFRRTRLYELELVANALVFGVRLPKTDTVWAAPVADGLRGIVFGDSFVQGTGQTEGALHPILPAQIAALLGQPDVIGSGVGSSGYLTRGVAGATLAERAATDVIAFAPDFVIDLGGINDRDAAAGNPTGFVAAYRRLLAQVAGALPDTLVFASGPMAPAGSFNTESRTLFVRDAKRSAAALAPETVSVLDNLGEAWVTGSGKTGAATGDGNADWLTSADGTHPSDAGATYLARRVVGGIAAALAARSCPS